MPGTWEDFYHNTPLDKIPWNRTQADFFDELLTAAKLGSGRALDLGCGVGRKSIALAKHGFEVTGIDISPSAINHAKSNAKTENCDITFITGDASRLSELVDGTFDLILDWANLHGIEASRVGDYVKGITSHTNKGSLYLLRTFNKHKISQNEIGFITTFGNVYLYSEEDIRELFGENFKILEKNRSRPNSHHYRWFDEYLMVRL